MADTMRAVVYPRYGRPEVLELRDVDIPVVGDNQMLVRVRAAAVNPLDWHMLTGTPSLLVRRRGAGWRRPRNERLGADYAGVIEAVGRDVTEFRPGDEVFGTANGAFAEYVCAREGGSVAHKPAGVSFEQAAAVPVAAVTALQALRDHGRLQPGQLVLVNGAAGGVGTFAVQLAKVLGAEVTGVCSTRNTDLVRSLGADHVIDYTREDFTRAGHRYDLLLDNIGNRSWSQYRRVLQPEATLLMVGGMAHPNRLIGPRVYQLRTLLAARRDHRTVVRFHATITGADLEVLAGLLETGRVTSVIDRRYRLGETAEALRYLGKKHVPGKIVITA